MRIRYMCVSILNVMLLAILSVSVYSSVYNTYYGQASPISAETPKVILQQGTAGTSTIYTNNTSAKVSVIASTIESIDSYDKENVSYECETVATLLSGSQGDDVGVWCSLPWNFSYYGENKSSIYLCSNGFATFDVAYNGYANSLTAMGTRKMSAPFWDDLRTDVNSYDGIYAENKTNPDRVVFYWRTTRYGDSSDMANFQLVLFSNGTIQFNWVDFTNLADFSPTSGMGKGDGTLIDITSEIADNKSTRFIHNAFDYVLEVVNQISDAWKIRLRVYDQTSIGRLFNCTIFFHNGGGVSRQISIYNGTYEQLFGNWYDLNGLSTVYIAMTVSATATGTSLVYAYLEVLVPGTSTYNLMVITFEIS